MFLSPEKHRSNARASPTERFENDSLKFVVSNRLSNPPIIHNSLVMIVHRSPPRDENDEIHPHLGQGTGPINARSLPQHCKNSRVESAEKIYERPRGKSRGEPWSIENRIGGSFHRCRNRWRGFITPVANRNLRAMSFYRKEEARNVRGFCCPRPLPPSSPLFPSFLRERGGGGKGGPPCIPPRLSSLGSHLSTPSTARNWLFAAIILPE